MVGLTDREPATVLAAPPYRQQDLVANAGDPPLSEHFEGGVAPPDADEIEGLCERLNGGPAAGVIAPPDLVPVTPTARPAPLSLSVLPNSGP
jgi:hypothetical protein